MTTKQDYFEIFCRLSQAFGTAATLQALLELIVRSATEVMNGKAACLFLADPKQDVFVPKAQYGLSDNYLHTSPLKAKKIVTALKKRGHLFFEDATSDPRLEHHDEKRAEGIASILTVAVMVDNRCIGVLSLYTAEKRKFSKQEIVFLKALAGNGGMAVKRARLLERMQKNAQLFLELTTAINSSLDIRQVLNNMTEKTCRALGLKGASIRLINEDSDTLDLVASYGLSDKFLNKGAVLARKSISEALQGKTIVIDDVAEDKRLQYTKETRAEGVASMVCVPIRSKESVIGVMRLYSGQMRQYAQDFLMLVEAVAHVGALAIQNASMYLTLKEDKQNLEQEIWRHRSYF
jgi:GAF domain-containing protein